MLRLDTDDDDDVGSTIVKVFEHVRLTGDVKSQEGWLYSKKYLPPPLIHICLISIYLFSICVCVYAVVDLQHLRG